MGLGAISVIVALVALVTPASASYVTPPFVPAQPVPCRCLNGTDPFLGLTANCTRLLAFQQGENCSYPYPTNAGFEMRCVHNAAFDVYGWEPFPQQPDVFFPENVLLDFCLSNFFSAGNILVPLSSNVSTFRRIDGTRPGTPLRGQGGTLYGETIYNYGWLLIVLNNYTLPGVSYIPNNGTVLEDLYAAQRFDFSNATQLWQSGQPNVKCQTITRSNFTTNTTLVDGVITSVPRFKFFNIQLTVFDQCNYDATIFIIVVATVGGAIIVATIIATFVFIILAIKKSRENYNAGGGTTKYQEMDRGE